MKFLFSPLLLALAVSASFAAAPPLLAAADAAARPVFLAQAGAARGAGAAAPVASVPGQEADTFAIPANGGNRGTATAGSAAARRGAAALPAEEQSTSLLQLVQQGGWAMYPLGFLSVVTVMLLIIFLFTLRRGAILTPHYMNTADVLLRKKDYLGLLAISSRHTETVARVVQRALDFATKNPNTRYEVLQEIAETEGGAQAAALQHRVTYLADIGVLSPMIGLLGTVSGIIRAFAKLGSGDATISRDILLASGVSEALIATATGLILGITAMGFYAIFRNRVHALISDMEIATAHIMGLLALSFTKKREGSGASSRIAVEEEF